MASIVKIKRSSVQGKAPTTGNLETGELALNLSDQKLFSSNGSVVFEIGSNLEQSQIGQLIVGNTNPFILPSEDGSAGQYLTTDGEGQVSWVNPNASADVAVAFSEYSYTASEGQVSFSGADDTGNLLTYTSGNISVFLNGIKLVANTDFLASNGTSVFLSSAASNNDTLDIQAFDVTRDFVDVSADLKANTETVDLEGTITIIDIFPITDYSTTKYLIQGTSSNGTSIQSTELLLIHDTQSVWVTEYATVNNVSTFLTFDASISASNVEVYATSDYANTEIKFTRMGVVPRNVS
jgi:hypothetical protein